jgi:hypothetical protein
MDEVERAREGLRLFQCCGDDSGGLCWETTMLSNIQPMTSCFLMSQAQGSRIRHVFTERRTVRGPLPSFYKAPGVTSFHHSIFTRPFFTQQHALVPQTTHASAILNLNKIHEHIPPTEKPKHSRQYHGISSWWIRGQEPRDQQEDPLPVLL